jgi:hypothetical protein
VNKPERIMALSLILVVCVRISRLAETAHPIPDQIQKPPARPTMRLSCFRTLKALRCSIVTRLAPRAPSFDACNTFISVSSLSLGRTLNHALFLPVDTAECGF